MSSGDRGHGPRTFQRSLRQSPETAPGGIPTDLTETQTRIVPHFVLSEFPAAMLGLVVASLAAAAMSSLDSDLNSVARVVAEDYYQRWRPDATDRQSLRMGSGPSAPA